jgi:hypothetical protein
MTSRTLLLSVAALAVLALPGRTAPAHAQPAQQQPAQQQPAQQQAGPPAPEGGEALAHGVSDMPRQAPILAVTSIEVLRSSHGARGDIIKATGVTSSSGWSSPILVPLMFGKPSDGVLDLIFQAETSGGGTQADSLAPIEALLLTDADHPFTGVRIRSATNAVSLKTLPGYAEAPAPADPCDKCVGKLFVGKGAAAPAGAAAADAVHEQNLPPSTRIIKPTDGIAGIASDPNRLTLVIGDDGRIVDAGWD